VFAKLASVVVLFAATAPLASAQPAAPALRATKAAPKPWRLGKSLGAPRWLKLGIEHQARLEYLANDFRAMANHDTRAFALRTLVSAEAGSEVVRGGIEIEDARTYASNDTPLNTTHVDALEILQAYVAVAASDVLAARDRVEVRAGRITIDLGTRRVVARNRFRNTINGFTGLDATWTSPNHHVARAFAAMPVERLPSDVDALHDNEIEVDEENTDSLLWALEYASPSLVQGAQLELYVVGFHERDGDVLSRDRQLVTVGARVFRKPATGTVDFDVELMPQVGTSRATTMMMDTTDLKHRAWSSHAEIGVSANTVGKPRFVLQHDYASGDRDPADDVAQRFDPLFGARRFEFGPTGIFGAFNRSNIQSPGVRILVEPMPSLKAFASYRMFWLASPRDAWVPAGVRDTVGESGSFVGEFVEAMVSWTPFAKNLNIEAGAAYLRPGQFANQAPTTATAPAPYVYTQVTVTL